MKNKSYCRVPFNQRRRNGKKIRNPKLEIRNNIKIQIKKHVPDELRYSK